MELVARVMLAEVGWLDLGDLAGARRRMLDLESTLAQRQEMTLFAAWAIYLAWILCEAPEEQAWEKAEALMARLLSDTSGLLAISLAAQGMLARVAFLRGLLDKAEELARAAAGVVSFAPHVWVPIAPTHIRALIGIGRTSEACLIAEQLLGVLTMLGGAGSWEVGARLAVTEAFEAAGDHDRARTELAETLRQVQLRLDDIADPFWKNSYLTRNRDVARTLALGRAWGLPAPAGLGA
jgi:hypothetical protein